MPMSEAAQIFMLGVLTTCAIALVLFAAFVVIDAIIDEIHEHKRKSRKEVAE